MGSPALSLMDCTTDDDTDVEMSSPSIASGFKIRDNLQSWKSTSSHMFVGDFVPSDCIMTTENLVLNYTGYLEESMDIDQ